MLSFLKTSRHSDAGLSASSVDKVNSLLCRAYASSNRRQYCSWSARVSGFGWSLAIGMRYASEREMRPTHVKNGGKAWIDGNT